MSVQLDRWASSFGDEYTARNVVDWRDRIGAWWTMLKGLEFDSVLEVGCNCGHNIAAMERLDLGTINRGLGHRRRWQALEPNRAASQKAAHAWACTESAEQCITLHLEDSWETLTPADLIFTCGVLIHVPPEGLDATLRRIHALSRKYILCIEYFAEQETMVPYRGMNDMLWKRNWVYEYGWRFGRRPCPTCHGNGWFDSVESQTGSAMMVRCGFCQAQAMVPALRLIRSGVWGKDSGFDDCHWGLWEKP